MVAALPPPRLGAGDGGHGGGGIGGGGAKTQLVDVVVSVSCPIGHAMGCAAPCGQYALNPHGTIRVPPGQKYPALQRKHPEAFRNWPVAHRYTCATQESFPPRLRMGCPPPGLGKVEGLTPSVPETTTVPLGASTLTPRAWSFPRASAHSIDPAALALTTNAWASAPMLPLVREMAVELSVVPPKVLPPAV